MDFGSASLKPGAPHDGKASLADLSNSLPQRLEMLASRLRAISTRLDGPNGKIFVTISPGSSSDNSVAPVQPSVVRNSIEAAHKAIDECQRTADEISESLG